MKVKQTTKEKQEKKQRDSLSFNAVNLRGVKMKKKETIKGFVSANEAIANAPVGKGHQSKFLHIKRGILEKVTKGEFYTVTQIRDAIEEMYATEIEAKVKEGREVRVVAHEIAYALLNNRIWFTREKVEAGKIAFLCKHSKGIVGK